MTPEEVKEWLMKTDKTVFDIAAGTKIHPVTIRKWLDGKSRTLPAYIEAIRRFVAEASKTQHLYETTPKASTTSRRLK